MGDSRVGEDVVQSQVGDSTEMSDVPCNELQIMIDGSRCDLKVGIGKDVARLLQLSADHTEHSSGREIERENGNRGEYAFFDVDEVALLRSGAEGTLEQLADRHGTGELRVSWDLPKPVDIRLKGVGAEQL